jgi:hypothetical protein
VTSNVLLHMAMSFGRECREMSEYGIGGVLPNGRTVSDFTGATSDSRAVGFCACSLYVYITHGS